MQNELNYTSIEKKMNEIICKFCPDFNAVSMIKGEINAMRNVLILENNQITNLMNNFCQKKKL